MEAIERGVEMAQVRGVVPGSDAFRSGLRDEDMRKVRRRFWRSGQRNSKGSKGSK